MYAAAFDYLRASSWNEAVQRLTELGDEAHVIAGGQSLVPMMMLRFSAPSALVDIGGVDERTIALEDGTLVLSALVRHVDLEHSAIVAEHAPMLTQAVRQIGNVRVRQRGTIGGSLAHGEPAAELP
jgi:CO/xanthine dehydrogenase FAD-binding subunit